MGQQVEAGDDRDPTGLGRDSQGGGPRVVDDVEDSTCGTHPLGGAVLDRLRRNGGDQQIDTIYDRLVQTYDTHLRTGVDTRGHGSVGTRRITHDDLDPLGTGRRHRV